MIAMPEFHPCRACGEPTLRDECSVCVDARDRRIDARLDVALAKRRDRDVSHDIPARYDARIGSPELSARVKHPNPSRLAAEVARATCALLIAPSGMGKSTLACAALRARAEGRFVSAYDLGPKTGRPEAAKVDLAKRQGLVLLDDVGNEDRFTSAVGEVLAHRYERALPTWVTSEHSLEALARRYRVEGADEAQGTIRRMAEHALQVRLGGR